LSGSTIKDEHSVRRLGSASRPIRTAPLASERAGDPVLQRIRIDSQSSIRPIDAIAGVATDGGNGREDRARAAHAD
jgi:hypothetical protein